MAALLRAKGWQGINPLLPEAEAKELSETFDTPRMVELLLQGLAQLPGA